MANSKDIRSKFRLEFEAPGADRTKKKIDQINEGLDRLNNKGGGKKSGVDGAALATVTNRNLRQMAHLQKQIGAIGNAFKNLSKSVDRLGKAMDRISGRAGAGGAPPSGGGPTPPGPTPPGGGAPPPGGGPTPPGPGGGGKGKGGSKKKQDPTFLRGLLQGLGLGDFYPSENRGGMIRQAGGNLLGRGIRGAGRSAMQVGGGLASSPFNGLSGLQTAAGGIPFVGGILAGMLQQGQGAAQRNLAYQQSRMNLGGFVGQGGFRSMARARAAGEEARQRVLSRGFTSTTEADLGPEERAAVLASERDQDFANRLPGSGSASGNVLMPGDITKSGLVGGGQLANVGNARKKAIQDINAKRQKALEDEADRAAGAASFNADPFARLAQTGLGSAMNAEESNQFALQLLQRGGGTLTGALDSGAVQKAMQAQQVFGAGPEATGAFIKGQRRGGIIGQGKNAGENIEATIKDAMSAGMDTSEVRDFLEQIAQAQDSFMRTGIPVNPRSLAQISGGLAGAGLGIGRGAAVAGQLTQQVQNIGAGGPQDAMDFLMLQKIGKFQGGGLEELVASLEKMENLKDVAPEDFLDLIKSISEGSGGGSAGLLSLKSAFGKKGANIGFKEARMLQALSTKNFDQLSEDEKNELLMQQGALGSAQQRGAKANLGAMSEQVTGLGGGVQAQKSIDNMLIFAGGKLLPAMQDMERSQANSVRALSEMAPSLKMLTSTAESISKELPGLARGLQEAIMKLMHFLDHPSIGKGG